MLKALCNHLLNFIYPSACLYCAKMLDHPKDVLCSSCGLKMQLAYHDREAKEMYCFEYHSVAQKLLSAFEVEGSSKIKELLVSYMVIQYMRHDCQMPDIVIPALKREIIPRNSVNLALAQAFAKRIERPCYSALEYVLDPCVYNQQGELVGRVSIKRKALQMLQRTRYILVLDGGTYQPKEYQKILTENGEMIYLSILNAHY